MLFFYLYILKCNDHSYYIGHTDDLENRIAQHQSGKYEGYTSQRLPLELVFLQEFATRAEALEMEYKIKRWSRIKKEALISKNWQQLSKLSKKLFSI